MLLAPQSKLIENCLRCSRPLSNPVSMYIGFGPICSGYLGIERPEYEELIKLNPEDNEQLAKLLAARQKLEAANSIEGTVKLNSDFITIEFKWECKDFYKIKDSVKSLGARWNPDEKQWVASKERGREIVEALQKFPNLAIDEELFALETPPPKPIRPGYCKLIDNNLAISFTLGIPDFARMKDAVKNLGAKWNPEKKYWTYSIHFEKTNQIISILEKYSIEIPQEIKTTLANLQSEKEKAKEMSIATDADIEIPGLNRTLYPFQKAGVAYAIEKERVLIADEMGLGKTCQAIAWLQATNSFPAIIVVPASLKLNWQREIHEWLPEKKVIILSGTGKNHAEDYAIDNSDVTVINYDILSLRLEQLKKHDFKAIILDESHYVKNKDAGRTKAALELRKGIPLRMCLTGTPILNRPNELIQPLSFLGRLNELGGFWTYCKKFCAAKQTQWGWDMSGASNLNELNQKLRETCMVRRRKQEVLQELPDKQRVFIPIELDEISRIKYDDAVNNFAFWLEEYRGKKLEEKAKTMPPGAVLETTWLTRHEFNPSYPEQLVKIEVLKQLAVKGKLDTVKEWISDFLETGEKLVVFAHHKEIIADLANSYPVEKRAVLVGDTTMPNRQAAVDKFQTDGVCQLFIGSMKAAGVGITLTAASNVAFVELGWTPADHDQAEDRCHRIGQKDAVTAWYFIAENTIENDIYDLILSKRSVVNMTTDGTIETNVIEKVMQRLMDNKRQ